MIEIGPLFMEYNNISLELQDVSSWILDQLNVCYSESIYSKLQKKKLKICLQLEIYYFPSHLIL